MAARLEFDKFKELRAGVQRSSGVTTLQTL